LYIFFFYSYVHTVYGSFLNTILLKLCRSPVNY
jgi:hypothetical protein